MRIVDSRIFTGNVDSKLLFDILFYKFTDQEFQVKFNIL